MMIGSDMKRRVAGPLATAVDICRRSTVDLDCLQRGGHCVWWISTRSGRH
jgi:hypothetical protein